MCNIKGHFSWQEVKFIYLHVEITLTRIEEPDNESNEVFDAPLLDFINTYDESGDMVDRIRRVNRRRIVEFTA